ncbi:MAG TPA: IclR family transcriptional regulator [Anaerolineales bacterium]|nr:IclR family transcriptional regulator [Anaerolineales bacterium]
MGEFARAQNDIVSVAMDDLNSLAKETGELVNLAILENDHVVYLAQVQGNPRSVVSLFTQIGARAPLYSTGVGKAILAYMPDEFVRGIIKEGLVPVTRGTITTETALWEALTLTRQRGYATDHEENAEGVCCVASCIWNGAGKVVGALSISGTAARINPLNFELLGQRVSETCRRISQKMGRAY